MGQGVQDEIDDVSIRQGVVKMRAFSPPNDQSLGSQQSKALRDGREFLAGEFDDLADAAFLVNQQMEQTQSSRIAEGAKQPAGLLDGFAIHRGRRLLRVFAGIAFVFVNLDRTPHFTISSFNEIININRFVVKTSGDPNAQPRLIFRDRAFLKYHR